MNGLDIAVISLLLISIGVGIFRGAIREVMNIAGWVIAYIVAHAFAADFAPYFAEWIGEPAARTVVSWIAVFLGVVIICSLVASLLSELVRKLGLSSLDRGVGALIGFARGVLVLLAITLAIGLTRVPQTETWRTAITTPTLEIMALYSRGVLPDSIAAKVRYRVNNGDANTTPSSPAAPVAPKSTQTPNQGK
jgi:membrane protein required for colicin V production